MSLVSIQWDGYNLGDISELFNEACSEIFTTTQVGNCSAEHPEGFDYPVVILKPHLNQQAVAWPHNWIHLNGRGDVFVTATALKPEPAPAFHKPRAHSFLVWTGENAEAMQVFLNDGHPHASNGHVQGAYVNIGTTSGLRVAKPGQYVVRNSKGDFDVVEADKFNRDYTVS